MSESDDIVHGGVERETGMGCDQMGVCVRV